MTAVRPGQRTGYQCLRGNDDCPGHPSKWMLCPDPATFGTGCRCEHDGPCDCTCCDEPAEEESR